jgi:hypothetical protein
MFDDERESAAETPAATDDSDDIGDLADILTGLYNENTANEPTTQPAAAGEGDPSSPDASPSGDGGSSDESTTSAESTPSQPPDWSSPEAQQFLDKWYADRRAAETRQAATAESIEELDTLVTEGRHEELGERFAREYGAAKAKKEAGGEVLKEFLTETYQKIFADPVFQNLSDAEKVELDPNRFSSDVEYIDHLRTFTATKKSSAASEADIEARVQEKLKALANERRGATVGSPSATGLPTANSGGSSQDDISRPSGDLLAEGLREEMDRKRGITSDV